jgi:stage II sporulation protein M
MLLQFGKMKHYFIACSAVYIAGIILGFAYSEQFQYFIESQLKAMGQIASSIGNERNPQLSLFLFIFWNNVSKSLLIIGLGVFFGILPLFFLLANGLLLGYLLLVQADSVMLLIKGILPHGIIEIPAIILAAALGLRLGFLVIKFMFSSFNPIQRQGISAELKPFILSLVPSCLLLVISLFVAAAIESTLTFWLVAR